jgi:hypothetical protein
MWGTASQRDDERIAGLAKYFAVQAPHVNVSEISERYHLSATMASSLW